MTIRLYIELGAALILAIAFGLYTAHERGVGEAKVHAADAKAEAAARRQADAETQLNEERNTRAEELAASTQVAIDAYAAAHPMQPVRLCIPAAAGHLSQAGANPSSATGAGPGPTLVPQVPAGDPGPDLSGRLDAFLRTVERLAVQYREWQER